MDIKSKVMEMFLAGKWSIEFDGSDSIPVEIQTTDTQVLLWTVDK